MMQFALMVAGSQVMGELMQMGATAGGGVETSAVGMRAAGAMKVRNPVPAMMARVIPGDVKPPLLGPVGRSDVFVTAAEDIAGLNASQLASRVTVPASQEFTVFRFATPKNGVASAVNRTEPGFIGGGLTRGGVQEFVLPNGPIPADATRVVIRK